MTEEEAKERLEKSPLKKFQEPKREGTVSCTCIIEKDNILIKMPTCLLHK